MKINLELLDEKYLPQAIETIKQLVKIPSYLQPAEKQAPFGKATCEVLQQVIEIAKQLGFKVYQDPENRYGYVEYGKADKIFAILAHLDVVPAGDLTKWNHPPFEPQIIDDKLYGRGTLDDKGPCIINLYALKYLKDHDFVPDYRVRLIFGLTEETTWESIDTYMKIEGSPDIGYSPDGAFPVTYAEKAIFDLDVISNQPTNNIKINGGEAYNIVNDYVEYRGEKINELHSILNQMQIENEIKNDVLIVKGTAAHGSTPEKGKNAAVAILQAINDCNIDLPIAKFVADFMVNDHHFTKFASNLVDETGKLIVNLGIIEVNESIQRFTLNIRIPATFKKADFIDPFINQLTEYNLQMEEVRWDPPLYFAKDSEMISKIMSVYKEVTNDQTAQPVALGGGTYAKAMANCVAFGADFDLENSTMHGYNEYVSLTDLQKMLHIYTKALAVLLKI